MKTLLKTTLIILLPAVIAGCTCPPPQPKPMPAPRPAPPPPAPAPMAGACGDYKVSQTYFTSGVIRLDKAMPKIVRLGQPFEYTLTVTNLTAMSVNEVQVRDSLPDSFKYVSSTPPAKVDGALLTWKISSPCCMPAISA